MRKYLVWISLLLCTLHGSAQMDGSPLQWSEAGKAEYNIFLQFKEHGFSGVCVMKQGESEWVGSIMNEFGIKAFDFVYKKDSGKIRLLNVIAFMNKWYIKKIVRADWKYLLAYPEVKKAGKKRKITVTEDGGFVLENMKYGIRYTFAPLLSTK